MTRSCGIYWWLQATVLRPMVFWKCLRGGTWKWNKLQLNHCNIWTHRSHISDASWRSQRSSPGKKNKLWLIKESRSKSETEFWGLVHVGGNSQCETAQMEMWENPPDQQAFDLKGVWVNLFCRRSRSGSILVRLNKQHINATRYETHF